MLKSPLFFGSCLFEQFAVTDLLRGRLLCTGFIISVLTQNVAAARAKATRSHTEPL